MKNLSFKISIYFLLFIQSQLSVAQSLNAVFKKAEEFRELKNYKEAIPLYEQFLEKAPKNVKANYGLGVSLLSGIHKTTAYQYLEIAYQTDPNFSEIEVYLANAYQFAHFFEKAKQLYQTVKLKTDSLKEKPKFDLLKRKIKECETGIYLINHPVKAKIDNLGNPINSIYPEYAVSISADEKTLIFTSKRPSDDEKPSINATYDEDIFISYKQEKDWSAPQNLGKTVNTKEHDASIAISADGKEIFIYKSQNNLGGDIYFSKKTNGIWSKPQPLSKKINTKYNECSVSLSSDGKILYFTSDKPGGLGGLDIYFSILQPDGSWGNPINLGATINTSEDDDAPFIHPDGTTLYFSSRGHDGMGGFDIFKSEFENGNWTKPENLGFPINSADEDIYFVISADNKHGYYASAKEGGLGENDIYIISMPPADTLPPFESKKIKKILISKPTIEYDFRINYEKKDIIPYSILRGVVTDEKSKLPLAGTKIKISNLTTQKNIDSIETNLEGTFEIPLLSGFDYALEAKKNPYLFFSDQINIPKSEQEQILIRYIEMKNMAIGSSLILKNIFYDFDKSTLKPASKAELAILFDLLIEYPALKIEISGHTDNVGSEVYNKKLSSERAKSVVDYLIDRGISQNRLSFVGYGKEKPIETNETEEGRQKNRRTEFKVVE